MLLISGWSIFRAGFGLHPRLFFKVLKTGTAQFWAGAIPFCVLDMSIDKWNINKAVKHQKRIPFITCVGVITVSTIIYCTNFRFIVSHIRNIRQNIYTSSFIRFIFILTYHDCAKKCSHIKYRVTCFSYFNYIFNIFESFSSYHKLNTGNKRERKCHF